MGFVRYFKGGGSIDGCGWIFVEFEENWFGKVVFWKSMWFLVLKISFKSIMILICYIFFLWCIRFFIYLMV